MLHRMITAMVSWWHGLWLRNNCDHCGIDMGNDWNILCQPCEEGFLGPRDCEPTKEEEPVAYKRTGNIRRNKLHRRYYIRRRNNTERRGGNR